MYVKLLGARDLSEVDSLRQVHALVPCVHRPTFMERVNRRDDRTDPLFFALLLSILAATIVHVSGVL
jgi:hypothetical protein